MDGKDVLHGVNKNDNKSRVMFSVICLLVVLIACLLIYMFVFKASGEGMIILHPRPKPPDRKSARRG